MESCESDQGHRASETVDLREMTHEAPKVNSVDMTRMISVHHSHMETMLASTVPVTRSSKNPVNIQTAITAWQPIEKTLIAIRQSRTTLMSAIPKNMQKALCLALLRTGFPHGLLKWFSRRVIAMLRELHDDDRCPTHIPHVARLPRLGGVLNLELSAAMTTRYCSNLALVKDFRWPRATELNARGKFSRFVAGYGHSLRVILSSHPRENPERCLRPTEVKRFIEKARKRAGKGSAVRFYTIGM